MNRLFLNYISIYAEGGGTVWVWVVMMPDWMVDSLGRRVLKGDEKSSSRALARKSSSLDISPSSPPPHTDPKKNNENLKTFQHI